MKARIFTFLMICFIANFFTAQTLVKPADFNIKDIASYLKTQNFVIDEIHDNILKTLEDDCIKRNQKSTTIRNIFLMIKCL